MDRMELKSEHSRQGVSVTFTYEQSTTLRGDEKQSRIPSGDESENNISCVSLMWMNYKGEEVEYVHRPEWTQGEWWYSSS